MKEIKNKNILQIVVIITTLLFVSTNINSVYGRSDPLKEKSHHISPTENITELEGNIVIKEAQFHRLYPSIEIPNNQLLAVKSTIADDNFYINSVLRIHIDTHLLDTNYTYRIGRHLKTFVLITRPGYSIIWRIVGKVINFNRSNFLSGDLTINVPFSFKSTENNEQFKIRILAVGGIIGAASIRYSSINYKVIDVTCHYYEPHDIFPPITTCHIYGKPINGDE